jgi:hypothetical protein
MQFEFSDVKHGECILIPGNFVVKERIKKTGGLSKYMSKHYDWIKSTFTGDNGSVHRICALFSSVLTIP